MNIKSTYIRYLWQSLAINQNLLMKFPKPFLKFFICHPKSSHKLAKLALFSIKNQISIDIKST